MKEKLDYWFRLTVVFGPPISYFILTIIVVVGLNISVINDIGNNVSAINTQNIIAFVYMMFLTFLTIHSVIKVSNILHKI